MKTRSFNFPLAIIVWILTANLTCALKAEQATRVEFNQDDRSYTLSNSQVSAHVSKESGGLLSLKYRGQEMLAPGGTHAQGYWSHSPTGTDVTRRVTIDPSSNSGERAEVAIAQKFTGKPLGSGPGGSASIDLEIRYSLGRNDCGIYTYCIYHHAPDYPDTSIGEARFAMKLNPRLFDWMTVDAQRNKLMATGDDWDRGVQLNMKEARRLTTGIYAGSVEHKYDYSAVQFDIPAFGWSSTKSHVGIWLVNPSIEYLSGGATKLELTAHLDGNTGGYPTLLNYWRGSHYGGTHCEINQGEEWTKVVGPFLIYCNFGGAPAEMWKDALARAQDESRHWPYAWVTGADYPDKMQRGSVTGQIILADPQAPGLKLSHLLVGLAHPDYPARPGRRGEPAIVDWQQDAKFYEFWIRGDEQGNFVIDNIRPGQYTLHAIADGVLGELTVPQIDVKSGGLVDLKQLTWTPMRFGRQLWDIGIPDRTAAEFLHGDHYWQWGLYNEYPRDFPNDVNFVIGKSDFHKDWNYAQCPRADRRDGTTWSITFDLPEAPKGKAILRLAFAGTSARRISVTVNDLPAGDTGALIDTAVIRRDAIRGYWYERDVAFDAGLLKQGTNVLKLTIPPGNPMNGVEYDYLRLELAPL
jgi:rhamnogalacturonan endolyase